MNLKALLIGINAYPSNPLRQCVSDMVKMSNYLDSLNGQFSEVSIKTMQDNEATKDNIILAVQNHLSQAGDDDVALLYYSGHGAQEQCPGLFADVHDGLLECIVCYDEKDSLSSQQLLASKEIRYLLSGLPYNPHLVTIFDACHSGDIVRSLHAAETDTTKQIKRISGAFPARPYSEFIFAEDETVVTFVDDKKQVFIPAKNHIHIAACLSSESSWENSKGGVFTGYLLNLLKATDGHLSYLDITRWAKISIQEVTREKQTPAIAVFGEGKWNATNSWLKLHPGTTSLPSARVINTAGKGWVYSRGALLGIQPGLEVIIDLDNGVEEKVSVVDTELEQSTLDLPLALFSKLNQLNKPYFNARTELNTFSVLKLAIHSIDHEPDIRKYITDILKSNDLVEVVEQSMADFQCNIFNGFVYFSLVEHDFQPLARQIEIDDRDAMKTELVRQMGYFIKWHHFHTLDNPGKDYEQSPIRIEVEMEENHWVDITNGVLTMNPEPGKVKNGEPYQTAKIRIKNVGDETLYAGVMTLNSDLSITSNPFQGQSVALKPGQTKILYDHKSSPLVGTFLDTYKQVYNWKEEWFYYKFIYNNHDDFTISLQDPDFLQPALDIPIIYKATTRSLDLAAKGESSGEPDKARKKWGTCLTLIQLPNFHLNVIEGNLKEHWEQYEGSEELAPFVKELYFDEIFEGTSYKLILKQNKNQTSEQATRATSNWLLKTMNRLYKSSRIRRFKRQRKQGGPVVIAEGDSWFLFPKPGVRDTLDYIMDHYRVLSLAEAGDEIADYIKKPELLTSVIDHNPDFVLISGGGNDILGAQIQVLLKSNVATGAVATDFLKEDIFKEKLEGLRQGYLSFFEKIHVLKPDTKIFIHGYDYIRSAPDAKTIKSGWANRYMIAAGIHDAKHRETIIRHLVDTFNDMLKAFANEYDFVFYVNHRGSVLLNEWMDEIHPNNAGYEKVANNFLKAMRSV